jgi:hypothetical protein
MHSSGQPAQYKQNDPATQQATGSMEQVLPLPALGLGWQGAQTEFDHVLFDDRGRRTGHGIKA